MSFDAERAREFGAALDFGRTTGDYRRYRPGFPPAFFESLQALGWLTVGQAALDLATGTGTVARGLARAGAIVTAADIAGELIHVTDAIDDAAEVKVRYLRVPAEDTRLPSASFDLVTVGQAWHWFDRPRAAAEVRRLLKPGGRIVIAHFDWIPLPGNVAAATEALILRHNPKWPLAGGNGVYPTWLRDLAEGGFGAIETFSFDHAVPLTHVQWQGRVRASAPIQGSLSAEQVAAFDRDLGAMLRAQFAAQPLQVVHRCWAASGVAP
jgi:SAM-dependent methyltransferase